MDSDDGYKNLAIQRAYDKIVDDYENARGNSIFIRGLFRELMNLEMAISGIEMEKKNITCSRIDKIQAPFGTKNLEAALKDQVSNHKLFEWLFCSLNTAYITQTKVENRGTIDWQNPKYETYNRVTNVDTVLNTIRNMALLSNEGSYGSVWKTYIQDIPNLVYIKTAKSISDWENDYLQHEFFVGYQLNPLRRFIPNFMYVYTLFKCDMPENGLPCQLGDKLNSFPMNYLLVESIKDAFPFQQLFKDLSNPYPIMSAYFQILLSLSMAYESIKFTHNDLHTGNIVIEYTKDMEPVLLEYCINDKSYFVKTNFIARILDYGLSHVEYKGMSFGNVVQDSIGRIDAFKANPLADIYRLSGSFLLALSRNGFENVAYYIRHIITRFKSFRNINNAEELKAELAEEDFEEFFYSERKQNLSSDTIFQDQLDYILNQDKDLQKVVIFNSTTKPDNIPVLNCDKCFYDFETRFNQVEGQLNVKVGEKRALP